MEQQDEHGQDLLPTGEPSAELPLIDREYLAELYATLGVPGVRRLAARLPPALAGDLEQLQRAWREGQLERLRNLAHRISGNAVTLGACRVGALSSALSYPLPDSSIEPQLTLLSQACSETLAALARLATPAGPGEDAEPPAGRPGEGS